MYFAKFFYKVLFSLSITSPLILIQIIPDILSGSEYNIGSKYDIKKINYF